MKVSWRDLCVYCAVAIVVFCTYPWTDFVGHAHWSNVKWVPFGDIGHSISRTLDAFANVLLYFPLGFSYTRSRSHFSPIEVLKLIVFAVALSASCESYQVFCHNRFPSMTDVATNAIGAVLGMAVAHIVPIKRVLIA